MANDLRETRIGGRELFKGDFLHAFRDDVRLPDGQVTQREYVVHPGAVMVVPLLQAANGELRLVMERQYRYPVRQTIIEFPAGKLDVGESPLACAQRELREETGYTAREWARVGVLHPVVSYSTEFIEIWFARGLSAGDRRLDDGEFIELCLLTEGELERRAAAGELSDMKTLMGLMWLQKWRAGLWPLQWVGADRASTG